MGIMPKKPGRGIGRLGRLNPGREGRDGMNGRDCRRAVTKPPSPPLLAIPPYMCLPTPGESCPTKPASHPMLTSKPEAVSAMVSLSTSGVSLVSAQSEICNGSITPLPPVAMAAASCVAVDTQSPELIGRTRAAAFGRELASRATALRAPPLTASFLKYTYEDLQHTNTHSVYIQTHDFSRHPRHVHVHVCVLAMKQAPPLHIARCASRAYSSAPLNRIRSTHGGVRATRISS